MSRVELTRLPIVKSAVINRWPQLAVFIVMLAGYVFAIVAGLIGMPVGSHNFSIVFVWIAWWAILILVAVPFFGRGWCAVCPIPFQRMDPARRSFRSAREKAEMAKSALD